MIFTVHNDVSDSTDLYLLSVCRVRERETERERERERERKRVPKPLQGIKHYIKIFRPQYCLSEVYKVLIYQTLKILMLK